MQVCDGTLSRSALEAAQSLKVTRQDVRDGRSNTSRLATTLLDSARTIIDVIASLSQAHPACSLLTSTIKTAIDMERQRRKNDTRIAIVFINMYSFALLLAQLNLLLPGRYYIDAVLRSILDEAGKDVEDFVWFFRKYNHRSIVAKFFCSGYYKAKLDKFATRFHSHEDALQKILTSRTAVMTQEVCETVQTLRSSMDEVLARVSVPVSMATPSSRSAVAMLYPEPPATTRALRTAKPILARLVSAEPLDLFVLDVLPAIPSHPQIVYDRGDRLPPIANTPFPLSLQSPDHSQANVNPLPSSDDSLGGGLLAQQPYPIEGSAYTAQYSKRRLLCHTYWVDEDARHGCLQRSPDSYYHLVSDVLELESDDGSADCWSPVPRLTESPFMRLYRDEPVGRLETIMISRQNPRSPQTCCSHTHDAGPSFRPRERKLAMFIQGDIPIVPRKLQKSTEKKCGSIPAQVSCCSNHGQRSYLDIDPQGLSVQNEAFFAESPPI